MVLLYYSYSIRQLADCCHVDVGAIQVEAFQASVRGDSLFFKLKVASIR